MAMMAAYFPDAELLDPGVQPAPRSGRG